MSSNLRVDTFMDYEEDAFEQAQRRQEILAAMAQLDAELATLSPSALQSSYQHHRSPIYKQSQQRRSSNVPRSMSISGVPSMSRRLSSDRIDMSRRPRALSQRSPASTGRADSRGTPSQRANVPFTQNGAIPLPLNSDRRENPAIMDWVTQEQPLTAYTFSHQPPQLQLSMSQRSGLEQVPELDSVGENPGDFILRTMGTGLSPTSAIPSSATTNNHRLSTGSFNLQAPSTPTSLTTATTLTSDMSRQNSLCNGFESMMKYPNHSFSADPYHDQSLFDQVAHFSPSHHSRRSSDDEQSQLLVGTGGASHESHFPHSFQFPSSTTLGEKMEKSQSVESTSSSTSTSSSRNAKRLQDQIAAGQARPLMPKAGSEGISMSRDDSSPWTTRIESQVGLEDKVAISKPSYQRPKHDRVTCKRCDNHPDGFRGEHELRRHVDREHKMMVKKWVCIEPTDGGNHPVPTVPLTRCKACSQQKKKYGAYYNAAAHLRRAHFNPKIKGRSKSQAKVDDADKRGGKAGGDDPPMTELKKYWMKEVEERADMRTDAQQEAADESEEETLNSSFDPSCTQQTMSSMRNPTFHSAIFDETAAHYSSTVGINNNDDDDDFYGMPDMSLEFSDSKQQVYMADAIYPLSNQNNFPSFSPQTFSNASLTFPDSFAPSQSFENFAPWN